MRGFNAKLAIGWIVALLAAVAVYAAGGRAALERLTQGNGAEGARRLLASLPPPRSASEGRG